MALLDRAIADYRRAVRDIYRYERENPRVLYDPSERWDMVIAARRLLEELHASRP